MKTLRRLGLLLALVVLSASLSASQVRAADDGCFTVDAKGLGEDLGFDPPGGPDGVTVAQVRGGGVLEGQWVEIYHVTGVVGNDATFTSMMIFSNERGLLKVPVTGVLNLGPTTWHYTMSGDITQGTGQFKGATGSVTFTGDEDVASMTYVETIKGRVCLMHN